MIVYLWELNRRFKAWVKRNGWKGLVIEFAIGLSLALGIYFIGDYFYERKLKEGQQCYARTIYIGVDKSNYLDNIQFKFITYTGDTILFRDPNISTRKLSSFDFSRVYTVKYLCDDPKYNTLLIEDWDESKYEKDELGRYLLRGKSRQKSE
jgi:hypothetical protein